MSSIANIIWFIFGGLILGVSWYIIGAIFYITIIGIPIGRACFEFGKLSMLPFGREIIRETELRGSENVSGIKKLFHLIVNILWFPIGIIFTLVYFALGVLSFITIIGIPVGIVYVRMGQFLLFPIGARVVTKKQAYASAAANEMRKRY
ncbi:MAG: hypothetical protein EOL97_11890 [Spirochaetia bacterium]|nr:hypothetical protein [Spirochaetia bacterium]